MNFQLFVLVLILERAACYTYPDYIYEFGKDYNSQEIDARLPIFEARMVLINETNSQDLPYKLKPNNFTDWTDYEIAAYVNATLDVNATFGEIATSELRVGGPTTFDWRDTGKVSPVKSQGTCGACWSFSSTSVYESLILMRNGTTFDLSEEYTVECSNRTYSSCGGGRVSDAMSLMGKNGIPEQSAYPYRGYSSGNSTPTTAGICSPGNTVKLSGAVSYKILQNLSVADMKSLVLTAPYVALVYADAGFMSYSSGVYGCSGMVTETMLNHAISIIGYDQNSFIIKNSWGTSWGVNGFMALSTTSNCGANLWVYQMTEGPPVASFNPISLWFVVLAFFLL